MSRPDRPVSTCVYFIEVPILEEAALQFHQDHLGRPTGVSVPAEGGPDVVLDRFESHWRVLGSLIRKRLEARLRRGDGPVAAEAVRRTRTFSEKDGLRPGAYELLDEVLGDSPTARNPSAHEPPMHSIVPVRGLDYGRNDVTFDGGT